VKKGSIGRKRRIVVLRQKGPPAGRGNFGKIYKLKPFGNFDALILCSSRFGVYWTFSRLLRRCLLL